MCRCWCSLISEDRPLGRAAGQAWQQSTCPSPVIMFVCTTWRSKRVATSGGCDRWVWKPLLLRDCVAKSLSCKLVQAIDTQNQHRTTHASSTTTQKSPTATAKTTTAPQTKTESTSSIKSTTSKLTKRQQKANKKPTESQQSPKKQTPTNNITKDVYLHTTPSKDFEEHEQWVPQLFEPVRRWAAGE